LAAIPVEDRNVQWRLEAAMLEIAAKIECAIASREAPTELIEQWKSLSADLEKENEERAKVRDVPPRFFFPS
jgi:ABC-type phosphate/phosphonate transport system substrate-binding protein